MGKDYYRSPLKHVCRDGAKIGKIKRKKKRIKENETLMLKERRGSGGGVQRGWDFKFHGRITPLFCLRVKVMANHLVRKWLPAECSLILCVRFYSFCVYMFSTGKQMIKNVAYIDRYS